MKSKSSDLQNFIADLQSLYLSFYRRWPAAILTFISVAVLVSAYTYLKGVSYESSGKILLEREKSTSSLIDTEIGELTAIGGNDPLETEVEIMRSVPVVQRVIDALDLTDDEGVPLKPENLVRKRLKIEKIRGTDLLKVSYTSDDPQEAADFVNRLMTIYLQNGVIADRQKALEAGTFISQQLPKNEIAVRQAEGSLRRFYENNRVTSIDTEAKLITAALDHIKRQASVARVALQSSQARYRQLQSQADVVGEQAVMVDSLSQDPGISDVAEELQEKEKQLLLARNDFEEAHPKILDLKEDVAQLNNLLNIRAEKVSGVQRSISPSQVQVRGVRQALLEDLVNVQAETAQLEHQVSSLDKEKQVYEKRLQDLPRLQQMQRELQRQLEASQTTYAALLKKEQEIRIAANEQGSNGRVVEYARAADKFLLKPVALKIVLGLLLGGMAAIGVVLLLELRDQSVKTVKEAKALFGSTLLGVIPFIEKSDKSLLRTNSESDCLQPIVSRFPSSPISEAYRMFQSNLRFMSTDSRLKTLVITSCLASEGKSTTAANLAASMAHQGHKVLLVDADLRHPTQHIIWESSNMAGLSDLIIGSVSLSAVVREEADGLHVLPAGAIPPEPGALLNSERMGALMEQFARSYDYVIVDTPPLLVASDSRALCKIADGVILTVRPGLLNTSSAVAAKELLEQIDLAILGIVANGVKPKDEPHSYFHYDDKYYRSQVSSKDKRTQTV